MSGPRFHLDHLFTRRRLSAYLDGELGPSSRGRIEGHIEQCADCGDAARSLPRVVGALGLLCRYLPSRIAGNVIARLRIQPPRDGDSDPR